MVIKKKVPFRLESLLEKISDKDIYRHYLGRDFNLDEPFRNPFYSDTNPGLRIWRAPTGVLYHFDWGDETFKGSVVDMVKRIYNISHAEALNKIDDDLQLGVFGGNSLAHIPITYTRPEVVEKKEHLFQVIPKKFTLLQWEFWNKFHISKSDILKTRGSDIEIHSIGKLWIDKKLIHVPELSFGYFTAGKYWKIYSPYEDKKKKWYSNIPLTTMYGLSNLPEGTQRGLIVKSVKDWLVARVHLFPEVAGTQNESELSISPDNIELIKKNVKHPYLCFDNDEAGVKACSYYNSFGIDYYNIPKYYKEKDLGEFIDSYGPEALRKEVSKKIELC